MVNTGMKRLFFLTITVQMGVLLAGLVCGAAAVAQEISFAGKQVYCIVNHQPGSAADILVRQIGPYLEKHLPGNPKIIFENKGAGRGKLGADYVFNSGKTDGLMIGSLSRIIGNWYLGQKMPVPLEKFRYIGARGMNQLVIIRNKVGYKTIDELKQAKKPIIVGMSGLYGSTSIILRMFFDMLDIPFKMLPGYRGQVRARHALLGGEIDMTIMNAELYLPERESIKEEDIFSGFLQSGMYQTGGSIKPQEEVGLETMASALRRLAPEKVDTQEFRTWIELFKSQTVTQTYVLPPGTPDPIVKVWAEAFSEAYDDPDYKAFRAARRIGDSLFLEADIVEARIQEFATASQAPAFKAMWAKYGPPQKDQKKD